MRKLLLLAFLYFFGFAIAQSRADFPDEGLYLAEIHQRWDSVPFFPAEYDALGVAPFRFIDFNRNFFVVGGARFFGFRFRTPKGVFGGLSLMFLCNYKEKTTAKAREARWHIMFRDGPTKHFTRFYLSSVKDYPSLQRRFPYTKDIVFQFLPAEDLRPDTEYLIWFGFINTPPYPELTLAFGFPPDGSIRPDACLPFADQSDGKSGSYEGDPL